MNRKHNSLHPYPLPDRERCSHERLLEHLESSTKIMMRGSIVCQLCMRRYSYSKEERSL